MGIRGRRVRIAFRLGVAAVSVVVLVLATDVVLTRSHSARGAVVAGVDAGHRSPAQLDSVIDRLTARAKEPVAVRTSSGSAQIAPADLGLSFDAAATRARLLEQPRNPFSRLLALFGREHDVEPVVRLDRAAMDATLDGRRKVLEKAAVEGGAHYQGARPVGDQPAGGMRIARDGAATALVDNWLDGGTIDLPMEPFAPTVSDQTVAATVAGPAGVATSAAMTLTGRSGLRLTMTPEMIGSVLTFVADGRGGLRPLVETKQARRVIGADLDRSQSTPVSATFSLSGGAPQVVPARDGARVNWRKTLDGLATRLVQPGPRSMEVVYDVVPPSLTTAAARKLGVKEVVSEFTTSGFTSASGENIRLVAQEVGGALVLPGKVFSLNGYTGPRGAAQGYVSSTIIDHGRAAKAVGGGISQFATTLYNAAYFAGLEDVDHTEHAYYISRYPEAREATVFEGAIDLKFRNNSRHGIVIETSWSPSSVTVRMWGTKTVEVESVTGQRYATTTPEQVSVPAGDDCIPSSGHNGFTTSNTRIIRDIRSGNEVSRHTRTVRYAPEPIVKCV